MREPSGREAVEPGTDSVDGDSMRRDRPCTGKIRIVEVEAASRIAKFGIASAADITPARPVERMDQAFQLGDEAPVACA